MKLANSFLILIGGLLPISSIMGGCSYEAANSTPNTTQQLTVALVFDEGGIGDKSFNDSAYAGLMRVRDELGAATRHVDSKNQADYKINFETIANNKPDLIVGVGMSMDIPLHTVAALKPEQKFLIIDVPSKADNVMGVIFKEEEGSFLAGILAGLMTKSNKIGFVGGKSIDLIKKFESGFFAGVKTVNPNCELLYKYTEDWSDVAKGKEAAIALYNWGADIVYHASGKCGIGVINAAAERGKYAIGVDSDQDDLAPGHVLTSMIKRVDNAVFLASKMVKEGKFKAGTQEWGIREGGVGLSEMKHTKDKIPQDVLNKVKTAEELIKKGNFAVPKTREEVASFTAPQL